MSKLSIPKLMCNNTISIAFHQQDNQPLRPPHAARRPLHTFLRFIFGTFVRRSSINQGRPWNSLQVSQRTDSQKTSIYR